MAGGRDDRPELRQVFVDLAPGTALVFGFVDDVGALLRRQRPAGLLRFVGDVGILEGTGGENGQREQGDRDKAFHYRELRREGRFLDMAKMGHRNGDNGIQRNNLSSPFLCPHSVSHPAPYSTTFTGRSGAGRQGQGNLVSEETFEFRRAQIRPGGDLNHRIIGSRRDEAFRAEAMPFRLRFPIVWTNAAPLARASPRLFGQDSWMVAGSPSNKKICTMKVDRGLRPGGAPSRKFADSSSIASPSPAHRAQRAEIDELEDIAGNGPSSGHGHVGTGSQTAKTRPPSDAPPSSTMAASSPDQRPVVRGKPARSVPPFLPRIPRPRAR